ncbi:MaoC/PaaZ C-terminal domain-containing protein [Pigmentiphaga litoralis]|uniref:Itaconyl-CoA hydratase n=1 Tax=Pigmentiphaga litoralis TaxID=516702 RepID=A0A7Y9LN15_9BURK|nr:MaoC/PaaZ C-terminal domain-containing protein [Pigmentiphaga litoralis]NYE23678.1 itaconyl-CoA hydratase [Pigmentiphaga litoralis]NYE82708.1 itaconyl-CoA hydratase [Pigmentiphaga litoralis]
MHTSYYRVDDHTYFERFGLGYDHLSVGQKFIHRPGITFSQQDNVNEALDSVNSAMVHFDQCFAEHTSWRKNIMVSTLTLQRLIGMTTKTFGRRRRIVAMSSIALTKAMFAGDTLYVESEVVGVEDIDGDLGRVVLRTEGFNQHGEKVATLDYTIELWRSAAGPDREQCPDRPALESRFASHLQRPDGAWLEQVGIFFEDLRVGETFIHSPRRTILAEEAVLHALRSLDWNPQTHDAEYARSAGLAGPVVIQTWGIGIAVALSTRTFGRVTVNLGWSDVKFGVDLMAGDTIEARSTVLDTRLSKSRPDEGVVTVLTEVHNQRGEFVNSYQRVLMVYRRSAPNPYGDAGY